MLKKVLLIPDCHFPHADLRAYRLMIQFAVDFKPDEVVILGDWFDVYCVSGYDKDPKRDHRFLSDELAYGISYIKELDTLFPKADFVFLEGNHETRLKKYVFKNASKLADRIDMKTVLGIPERWKFYPYGRNGFHRIGKNWIAMHGVTFSQHFAATVVQKFGCNVIQGHVHRIQEHYTTKFNGDVLKAMSCGWLGDVSEADYILDFPSWQHGFAVGYFKRSGNGFVQNVPIIGYETVAEGRHYKK